MEHMRTGTLGRPGGAQFRSLEVSVRTPITTFLALCVLIPLLCGASFASSGPSTASRSGSASSGQNSKQKSTKASSSDRPTAAEIAAAKASGKVWVNLNTGIYHHGGRWYGKTKSGRFMTLEEAKKAGYKPSKRD
jgi:hypothetical protein